MTPRFYGETPYGDVTRTVAVERGASLIPTTVIQHIDGDDWFRPDFAAPSPRFLGTCLQCMSLTCDPSVRPSYCSNYSSAPTQSAQQLPPRCSRFVRPDAETTVFPRHSFSSCTSLRTSRLRRIRFFLVFSSS